LRELRAGSKGRSREAAARLAGFAAGVALPGLLVVLVLAGTGSLSKFWF
jgi:tetrahydromethanopterin S-methyltransferase subunit F